MKANSCESCLMPLAQDKGPRESDKYCSKCFRNGKLVYEGNYLKEFQRMAYEGMRADGMNLLKARLFAWSIRFAPRWRKK